MSTQLHKQSGFSLLELVIALSVMLVIMASVFSLLKDSLTISLTTYELSDAQESLRTGHEYINRDLLIAGDGLRGLNNICVRSGFVSNYITKNTANTSCGTSQVILPLIHSDDSVPANTTVLGTTPSVTVRSTPGLTDRITILQRDPSFAPVALAANAVTSSGRDVAVPSGSFAGFQVGEIYFITSSLGATFGTITQKVTSGSRLRFSSADTYGLNLATTSGPIYMVSGAGTQPAAIMRMRIVHYFVDQNGLLIKRVFGVAGQGFIDSVIAENMTDLQLRYILNVPAGGGFIQQPTHQLSSSVEQAGVRQVEVTLSAQTAHPVAGGSHKTISMTNTTGVRNLQFNEALQP